MVLTSVGKSHILVRNMAAKRGQNASKPGSPRIVNRKAWHDFHIDQKLEVGVVLKGCEVKSVRNGQVSLAEGYTRVEPTTMEMHLHGVNIAEYAQASGGAGYDPIRTRKLLAHKRQIDQLLTETCAKGATLIPLAMYFVRGMVKLEIGVAKGKKQHDKRQTLRENDAKREIRRAMTKRTL